MPYRYELHLHTAASPDSRTPPANIIQYAEKHNLDGVAITDHDTMDGVAAVQDAAPDGLDVVPGVEITTAQGHLLAYGIDTPPDKGVSALTAIEQVHEQGGYTVLAHPFDPFRDHYRHDLDAIADAVDGVEVLNARCPRHTYNTRAREYAEYHGLERTGGSDAHLGFELGRVVTVTDVPLLEAFEDGGFAHVEGHGGYVSSHVLSKVQHLRNLLGL